MLSRLNQCRLWKISDASSGSFSMSLRKAPALRSTTPLAGAAGDRIILLE